MKKIAIIVVLIMILSTVVACTPDKNIGTWETTSILIDGKEMMKELGEEALITLVIEQDGNGIMSIDGMNSPVTWAETEEGINITDGMGTTVSFLYSEGDIYSFNLDEIEYTLTKLVEEE